MQNKISKEKELEEELTLAILNEVLLERDRGLSED